MTDQDTPESNENDPSGNAAEGFPWSITPPPPVASDEDTAIGFTQPLPPYEQPASSSTLATAPARRPGGITAAVLAGALLLGGAAGVGGAAWYDAWNGDDNSTASTTSSNAPVTASNAAAPASGSVEKVASAVLPSVVKINVSGSQGSGSGSGIVLSKDGNILTNNHVVALASGGGTMTVSFNDGNTVKASVLGTDPVTDIAVIKADGVSDLTPATFGSSSALKVGQSVVAVGSPYGLNSTVTTGIVSALNRPVSVATEEQQTNPFGLNQQQSPNDSTTYPAIQTDAAINPGNSGGPLVNMAGQVVGVNSSIRTADSTTSSGGSIGLGFAIPVDELRPIIDQIIKGDDPTHARLAITVSDVAADKLTQGAQIREVQANGAAAKAGLKAGDVITKVDDEVIDGQESLIATVRGHRPGDQVTVTYLRDGKTETAQATLGSDADTQES